VTAENEKSPPLPQGWIWTRLEELADVVDVDHKMPRSVKDGVHFISPKDFVDPDGIDFENAKRISEEDFQRLSRKCRPESGDLIYSRIGTIGKVRKVPRDALFQVSYSLCLIKPVDTLKESDILYVFLKSPSVLKQALAKRRSIGVPDLGLGDIKKFMIPLAPINEQKRIVGWVEELFSRLDAGVEGLRKVKAQLKRYRQAVLKYAFEGKLTEEWRKTHEDQIEPATKILEQISQENAVESNLPELPEGWIWTRLELITINHDGKRVPVSRKKRESMKGVYPYYGASGIIDSVDNYLFDGNFLLIGEDGANLLARATPIAFQATGKFWVNNHAHVLTPLGGVPISYLEHFINRISLAEYVTGTAQPKLTQRAMNKIPVPLAPIKEQYKIAEEISRRFSVIDEISKEMELMIKYSDRLRQSILKTAFEGKLVPQDPNDESAEKLLERIREERAKSKGARGTNKGRKNKPEQLELSTYVE
jgi:type I restriction enzyme S subunit